MSHEQWQSRHGFILATIGAAVGIGNIWRFSYVAGENGGAVFLFLYVIFVVLIGLPLVVAELSLGRRAQGDAVEAFEKAGARKTWGAVGWVSVAGAILILSYYAVIAGWSLKYFVGAVTGSLWTTADAGYSEFFRRFIGDHAEPVVWQAAIVVVTVFAVAGGVQKGIERVNRLLMPVLAIILTVLAIYALSLPNSGAGLAFLFSPDWSVLGDPTVYIAALGQAFFSLGVGMAIFITYGSYMPRDFSLPKSAAAVAFGDSLFAIVAGLAIFPAVFSFGIDPAAGPELAFITLPQVFLAMPAGEIVGAVFFLLLSASAFTSMMALLEVPVSVVVHQLSWRRWLAALGAGLLVFTIGIPSALSFGLLSHIRIGSLGILDALDAATSNVLLPIGGILVSLVVGWIIQRRVSLHESDLAATRTGIVWLWLLKTLVPASIIAMLLHSAFGVLA